MEISEFENRFATGKIDLSPNEIKLGEDVKGIEIYLAEFPIVTIIAQLEHIIHQEVSIPVETTPIYLTIGEGEDSDTYQIGEIKYTIDKHRAIQNLFKMYKVVIYFIQNGGKEKKEVTYEDLYHTVQFSNLNNIKNII